MRKAGVAPQFGFAPLSDVKMTSSPILWVLFLGAAAYCMVEWRKVRLGMASRQWKPIQCRVLKVSIDEQTSSTDADSVRYSANVSYAYKISSVVYQSTCLTYQPTSGLSYEQAVRLIAGVLPGDDVTAYYNPRIKSQAVLIRTNDTGNAMPFVISGLAAVLLAMWILTTGTAG